MRIYLDCCCLQRPFDDQRQPRIRVEAEAVLAILASVEAGDISLLNSEALEYEMSRIPEGARRREGLAILALAAERLDVTPEVEALSQSLEDEGIGSMDAIHLAFASQSRADYFATCDDKLLRKSQSIPRLDCRVVSVLTLVQETLK
ncbi:MAG: PIN domain-containing protein [Candidatus Binatia bacterium]